MRLNYIYIIILLTIFSSCKQKNTNNSDTTRDKTELNEVISIEEYENVYNDKGLLVSSIKRTTVHCDSPDGEVPEHLRDEKLIYFYKNGNLSKIEAFDLESNMLTKINLYYEAGEETYSLLDSDTITYSKELRNKSDEVLIRETKNFPVAISPLSPSHLLLEVTYDDESRIKTYKESDLLNRTSIQYFYDYHFENDELIGNVFDENQRLWYMIKFTTMDNVFKENRYDPTGYLLHTKEIHKEGEHIILIVEKDFIENFTDSLFYDHKGQETKYISISEDVYTKTIKDYDDKGSLLKVERSMIRK